MESDRISMIEDWATRESVQEVQVLLVIANSYRTFIWKYAKVTAPKSNFLKKQGSRRWEWTRDAELPFCQLQQAFTEAPILQHSKLPKVIILQTDASSFTIAGILNHYDGFRILNPVNFNYGKSSYAEQNYAS
jgi:hypothetical protein